MELFKNTNFDFLGKKWPFIIASLILTVLGLGSLVMRGGPRYGIEFKGGMMMTVKFQGTPPLDAVRNSLTKALSNPPSVQTFENGSNEIAIGTEGADDATLAKNRQLVLDTLAKTFGHPDNGKLDLNNASAGDVANRLRDPLQRAGAALSDPQIDQLGAAIVGWRNQHGGLLTSLDELRQATGVTPQVLDVLKQQSYLAPYTAARDIEIVGPKVGADMRSSAIEATLLALAGMLLYIWFRFEWIYGAAAVSAVFHDTIITIGIFSLFNKEITLTVISLYLFGGPVLHGFSFALVAGIIVGTYSSVYIASPIVLGFHDFMDARKKGSGVGAPPVPVPAGPVRQSASKPATGKSPVRVAK
jgi:preprotein translocase subunit SecF